MSHTLRLARKELDDPTKQVRLLRVLDDKTVQFQVYNLDSVQDQYTAVSYVWGDNASLRSGTIDIVGSNSRSELAVSTKLLRVISHMLGGNHLSTRRRLWWIDALCINQDDEAEKSHQVRLMGKIYACAEAVVAFLDTLEWQNPKSGDSTLRSGCQLLRDPYFDRMWIVQELLLAQLILIADLQPPDSSGPPHRWERVLAQVALDSPTVAQGSRRLTALLLRTQDFQKSGRQHRPLPLIDAMKSFGFGQCGDPRDQIYSLLSLACNPDGSPISFPVDYSKTKLQVFEDFVQYMEKWYAAEQRATESYIYVKLAAKMDFSPTEAPHAMKLIQQVLNKKSRNELNSK